MSLMPRSALNLVEPENPAGMENNLRKKFRIVLMGETEARKSQRDQLKRGFQQISHDTRDTRDGAFAFKSSLTASLRNVLQFSTFYVNAKGNHLSKIEAAH
jgi:hypothetical protein